MQSRCACRRSCRSQAGRRARLFAADSWSYFPTAETRDTRRDDTTWAAKSLGIRRRDGSSRGRRSLCGAPVVRFSRIACSASSWQLVVVVRSPLVANNSGRTLWRYSSNTSVAHVRRRLLGMKTLDLLHFFFFSMPITHPFEIGCGIEWSVWGKRIPRNTGRVDDP